MKIFRRFKKLQSSYQGASVALGNFDGLHLGHAGVIKRAAEIANSRGVPLGVLTFEPHPVTVLRPKLQLRRLAPFRTKVRLLKEFGVEILYMLPFSKEFSQLSASQFVTEVLVKKLNVSEIVMGYDYRFGKGRRGDHTFLLEQGKSMGFGVTEVAGIGDTGKIYSSTRVREFIGAGKFNQATAVLGHIWEVEGRVRHGDARGRQLGYPTANIVFGNHVVPAYGIYAVWCGVQVNGVTEWVPGVANVGIRPMFRLQTPLLEVHLFDYDDDLYGKYLRVAFLSWIRPEQGFDNVESLVTQMDADCCLARTILSKSEPPSE